MEILLVLTGMVVGITAGWLIARLKYHPGRGEGDAAIQVEQERNRNLLRQIDELKTDLAQEREKRIDLNNSLAATEADYRNLQEKLEEQKKDTEALAEKFSAQFKALANDIFEEKS